MDVSSHSMFSTLTVSQFSENRKAGQPVLLTPDSPNTKGGLVREPGSSSIHSYSHPNLCLVLFHPSFLLIFFLGMAVNVKHTATFQEN